MSTEKGFCWGPDCTEEIDIVHCCNGHECGCMGQPALPPFCSQDCWDNWNDENAETKSQPPDVHPMEF